MRLVQSSRKGSINYLSLIAPHIMQSEYHEYVNCSLHSTLSKHASCSLGRIGPACEASPLIHKLDPAMATSTIAMIRLRPTALSLLPPHQLLTHSTRRTVTEGLRGHISPLQPLRFYLTTDINRMRLSISFSSCHASIWKTHSLASKSAYVRPLLSAAFVLWNVLKISRAFPEGSSSNRITKCNEG